MTATPPFASRKGLWCVTCALIFRILGPGLGDVYCTPTNPYTFSGAVSGEEYAALRLGEFAAASFHTAQQLNDQGVALKTAGRFKEAEAVLGKAVDIKERLLGTTHPLLATSLASLAELYLSWGGHLGLDGREKLERARSLAQRALDIRGRHDPKAREMQQLLKEAATALSATTPPRQTAAGHTPSESQLARMLPANVALLKEAEPAFRHLNRSMRWSYHALPLKEEWLHVQVEGSPPRVFGIQAVRLVSLLSEEPKVTLYVKHSRHSCHNSAAFLAQQQRAGTELLPECLEEWSIAGGDVKPSTYENFDRVGKLPVEAPYQLLEARKHAHVWYHSVELSQSKGNVGLLSVRLGTKSLGDKRYVLRSHTEPLIPLNERGGLGTDWPEQQTWTLDPLRVNFHYLKPGTNAQVTVSWPLLPGEHCLWEPDRHGCSQLTLDNLGAGPQILPSLHVTYAWDAIPVVDRSSLIGRDAANGETFVDARDVQVARHVVVHGAETNWPSFQSRPDPPPGATVEYTLTFKRPHDCAAAPAVLYIGVLNTRSALHTTRARAPYNISAGPIITPIHQATSSSASPKTASTSTTSPSKKAGSASPLHPDAQAPPSLVGAQSSRHEPQATNHFPGIHPPDLHPPAPLQSQAQAPTVGARPGTGSLAGPGGRLVRTVSATVGGELAVGDRAGPGGARAAGVVTGDMQPLEGEEEMHPVLQARGLLGDAL